METKESRRDIYLGNLKSKTRKTGEEFLAGSICLEQMCDNIPEELIEEGTNGKHYVRIIIQKNFAGPDKFGNTHSIKVDNFNPASLNNSEKSQ